MFISTNGMDIDKKKPSILLMHGSGLTLIVWSLHEQFYSSQGFNVLSVDIPGHGNSEGPALKSIEEISDWIKALIIKADIKKIIIIGHSQGGLVGIDFASRYPELTDKIVLVSASYKMPVNQELIDFHGFNTDIITDKAPQNFIWLGFIKIFFPNSKIIHCSRNPRDNCLSLYKNYFPSTIYRW